MACMSNVQYSILINGKLNGCIKPNKGIRQGDSLSPFVFVIVMDYLSKLFQKLEEQGKVRVYVSENCHLTHLLFANDILIFAEDNDEGLENIHNIIKTFEVATGFNINMKKSTFCLPLT